MSLRGREAARLIWDDDPAAAAVVDPRQPAFSSALLSGLASAMLGAPGVIKKVVGHAGAAAEDLNVEAFQGLVEILQNADDLGASGVRFALDEDAGRRRLLVVHDGTPVTCHHVLAMTLPYLTTKTGDAEQKGRFGIGLKTLRRIATRVFVHSEPYNFAADGMVVRAVDPAPEVPGFYAPAKDTLFELELADAFDAAEFKTWFSRFDEENLLFLKTVATFAFVDLSTGAEQSLSVARGPWVPLAIDVPGVESRSVQGTGGRWTVFRTRVPPPVGIDRSLKATGDAVTISIALPDEGSAAGLFIGFRTRVPVVLPFALDAQFDPSTAREGLIENTWNRWLIARVGEALTAIALSVLATCPLRGWSLVPTAGERVGLPDEPWPHDAFASAFGAMRTALAKDAKIGLGASAVQVPDACYEATSLEGLLQSRDLSSLRPQAFPLPQGARDPHGRWRRVLRDLAPAGEVHAAELAGGFRHGLFGERPESWWIAAADRLTANEPAVVLETPCWLSDAGRAVKAHAKGTTKRPLVIGEPLSPFAAEWGLFDRLADGYRRVPAGERALAWLVANAAVTSLVDAGDELAAFAEAHEASPVDVSGAQLRELRDRFDLLNDRNARLLGPRVGATLRLDAFVWRRGKKADIKAAPTDAYLPRTLDSDYAFWPEAAGNLPDIVWLAASYDDTLRTGATRASRKRSDGTISRGPRKFLMLLGASCSPRVVVAPGRVYGGSERSLRSQDLRRLGAEYVKNDHVSPHLDSVLAALHRMPKRERRSRSAALLKALSRYWDLYEPLKRATAFHMATKYEHQKGEIDAGWFSRLRESEWVAVGTGELVRPEHAVVRSPQTQTTHEPRSFIADIGADDLRAGFAAALRLITEVRTSDLVGLLENARSASPPHDAERLLATYRALAKLCPSNAAWNQRVGDLTVQDLRRRFADGAGLIWVDAAKSWRRPEQLFTGRDIFHAPERFVPGGPSCSALWQALEIGRPGLEHCIPFLRSLGTRPYTVGSEAVLIDVYRHIDPLLPKAERRQRGPLRTVPVGVAGGWSAARPVLHVSDRELRERLAEACPYVRF